MILCVVVRSALIPGTNDGTDVPRIFDNIDKDLLPALRASLEVSRRADFCVGYFNLRGWKQIDDLTDKFSGLEDSKCRVLVGMQKLPQEELRETLTLAEQPAGLDGSAVKRLRRQLAEQFRHQLTLGAPTDSDEVGLQKLARQLRAGKVAVRLFLAYSLHAKLYLLYRDDPQNPMVGYVGSSNLTFSGLLKQGELNVDVLDEDACNKLSTWFGARWNERWCEDISEELAELIEQSWAREHLISPYHVYLKMAYHLSREARQGVNEFRIPKVFDGELLEFQARAVQIAANHLNKRHGVLIGDVVGLGKTRIGAALARMFEDEFGIETLIISPKNLVPMWENYRERYGLRGRVTSLTRVVKDLSDLRPYRLVMIDESHNLRNREGRRYKALLEYIRECQAKVILLSATPYNKDYVDLSNQLRLFLPEDKILSARPERLIDEEYGGNEHLFESKKQCKANTLQGFEHSPFAEDWRNLLRHYMVRRTRSFILEHYASLDEHGRPYLTLDERNRAYFPKRQARTLGFSIRGDDATDQYAQLYADDVVEIVNHLKLPRYGLGNYVDEKRRKEASAAEARALDDLTRAGRRLMGFCRTNLFKRLESSGASFLVSLERHALRNYVFLFALEQGQALPIGSQDAALLDPRFIDDEDGGAAHDLVEELEEGEEEATPIAMEPNEAAMRAEAARTYRTYTGHAKRRFRWVNSKFFKKELVADLMADVQAILALLRRVGNWDPAKDAKLLALTKLIEEKHPKEKLLIFTQFADTARYLGGEFERRKIKSLAVVTGDTPNPSLLAWRFSPVSNGKRKQVSKAEELRVLVATDVLSEGQNLQDASIVVNYDLPWAIIRLIQRAGRVDRIGQQSDAIDCYSFMPVEGVERIIRLRARVRERLKQNAEVVGTDEAFFEDEFSDVQLHDLYNEKTGILDDPDDNEVDLSSYAWQIWNDATKSDPELRAAVETLPAVAYSAKTRTGNDGVLVYLRTPDDNDALAWLNSQGIVVTESQLDILRAAACVPDAPAQPRAATHHDLVRKAVEGLLIQEKSTGGNLGRPSGPRARTYERLKRHAERLRGTLFESQELLRAIDDIFQRPLKELAADTLQRQFKAGVSDDALAELVLMLREEGKLTQDADEAAKREPQIICSLGLV